MPVADVAASGCRPLKIRNESDPYPSLGDGDEY